MDLFLYLFIFHSKNNYYTGRSLYTCRNNDETIIRHRLLYNYNMPLILVGKKTFIETNVLWSAPALRLQE